MRTNGKRNISTPRGGSMISGKGVYMYKCVGGGGISFFLNIPRNLNNLVSLRPNYFIFMGYLLKTWGMEGVRANPLNPLWIRHCRPRSTDHLHSMSEPTIPEGLAYANVIINMHTKC